MAIATRAKVRTGKRRPGGHPDSRVNEYGVYTEGIKSVTIPIRKTTKHSCVVLVVQGDDGLYRTGYDFKGPPALTGSSSGSPSINGEGFLDEQCAINQEVRHCLQKWEGQNASKPDPKRTKAIEDLQAYLYGHTEKQWPAPPRIYGLPNGRTAWECSGCNHKNDGAELACLACDSLRPDLSAEAHMLVQLLEPDRETARIWREMRGKPTGDEKLAEAVHEALQRQAPMRRVQTDHGDVCWRDDLDQGPLLISALGIWFDRSEPPDGEAVGQQLICRPPADLSGQSLLDAVRGLYGIPGGARVQSRESRVQNRKKPRAWADEEIQRLLTLAREGKRTAEIARIVGRSESSVRTKLKRLGDERPWADITGHQTSQRKEPTVAKSKPATKSKKGNRPKSKAVESKTPGKTKSAKAKPPKPAVESGGERARVIWEGEGVNVSGFQKRCRVIEWGHAQHGSGFPDTVLYAFETREGADALGCERWHDDPVVAMKSAADLDRTFKSLFGIV